MKDDSKKEEVETPSEESAEENQSATEEEPSTEEETSQKDESSESLEDRLVKLEKKSSDFERAYHSEKKKRQELELKVSDNEPEPTEVQKEVQTVLKTERIQSAFKKAIEDIAGNISENTSEISKKVLDKDFQLHDNQIRRN